MSQFYTNVSLCGKNVLLRYIEDGVRKKAKIPYKPKLFVSSNEIMGATVQTKFKTLFGQNLSPVEFGDMYEARDFIKRYDTVANFKIYGHTQFEYAFISDEYPGEIKYDPNQVSVGCIDIEVSSERGFPKPEHAFEPITAITYYIGSTYYVFGCGDFSTIHSNIFYIKCKDETDLINQFLKVWTSNIPDIVTGWSSNIFDFPYIINRMKRLFFEPSEINSLSPWKNVYEREYYTGNKKHQEYKIVGVAMLDYHDLYQQFRIWSNLPKSQSMKLNYVSYVELGEKKIDYSEYENLHTLYKLNYQKFIEYNIKDVSLVVDLEKKLNVIKLFLSLAYSSKTNYEDPFFQVRMWDAIIYNHLKKKGIQIPPKSGNPMTEFVGGYVKDPKLGLSKWIVSYDFDGMYPHAIMNYNISPETLIESKDYDDEMKQFLIDNIRSINVEGLRSRLIDTSILKRKNITLTPNGQFFRLDKQGFLPELMAAMYKERAHYKKASIAAKMKLEVVTDTVEKVELKHSELMNNLYQQAKKVCLNSAYGVTGNKYFRFFDVRIAEAITTSSQLSTRFIEEKINEKLNHLLNFIENKNFVIAADTDSCYITLEDFINPEIEGKNFDPKQVIAKMDKFCKGVIQPFIDVSLLELSNYLNAYDQKFRMKRESLCDKGIWVAKKRYLLNIYDKEGVVYSTPKVDVTGLEGVRSTTPEACRGKINEVYNIILNKDKGTLIEFVDRFREEFKKLPIQDIAVSMSVNGLSDYFNKDTIYGKKTP